MQKLTKKFIAIMLLFLSFFTCRAIASELLIPIPKTNETLLWGSSEWRDADGGYESSYGPSVIKTKYTSHEELIEQCYEDAQSQKELDDCLVTFEEGPSLSSEYLKITDSDVFLLQSFPEQKGEAFLKLSELGILNPVDQLLEETWINKDLFEMGALKVKEVSAEITTDFFEYRRNRFAEIAEELEDIPGLEIIAYLVGLDFVHVNLSLESLAWLEDFVDVSRVMVPDLTLKANLDVVGANPPILDHMQLQSPYYIYQNGDTGNDGEYNMPGSWSDVVVAVMDPTGMNGDHVAFKESTGSNYRIFQSWKCGSTCEEFSPPTDITSDDNNFGDDYWHGTEVAGLLAGDLRDGQDPAYTSEISRSIRSGQAPEAGLVLFDTGITAIPSMVNAFDRAVESNVHLISASVSAGDYSCEATSSISEAANAVYETGILSVFSAGNQGDNGNACSVGSPADAEGVLAVGAIGSGSEETAADWDAALASDYSSHGPHTYYGSRVRTIVDLVAPGTIQWYLDADGNSGSSGYNYQSPVYDGTSFSQPRVAASLVDAIDFMVGERSDSMMLLPGVQRVFMLMMGDRSAGQYLIQLAGFSSYWGAGRTKMRRIDDIGLDTPWGRQDSAVCVGDGEVVDINIKNGQLLSSDVDSFKAAIWWYTSSFSSPIPNDIDLRLQWSADGTTWTTIRSDIGSDLKKMVYYQGVGNHYLRLRVTGTQVNSAHGDGGSCASGKARIYFIWIYEDDDRDDADGPDADIDLL
ncbi:MAG: S8 family peptidase [Myxococcales bacterium]|nr:S8 family peptidase [Myxococcales bacterium]